ncbi:MAG TPA: sn-glycerol-3-phosphate ABC transporter ATP-binding protein UgpC [Candidatus Dormibacteraeota bacterium]|nr:sn-glycerol-3-phosphate ABC transporter ATP-binding protein UgpC [Candidatus Dormibacteraeota bacterium]
MATIELDHVTKIYPNKNQAVSELSLDVADGEFMVLVGPSGCGKTTALRMVAGLEEISGGTVRIGGKVVNDLSPKERDVAMVFQNYALYPHMTVAENIGFSLKLRHLDKAEINRRVQEAGQTLGLESMLNVKPVSLSGGQRQRVAMGRALVREPAAFLMDEPLSNLDAKLRVQMRAEVSRIQRRLGVATLYVTHDQTEAMTMGDRVAVLAHGVLQQCEAPQTLYDHPANLFVAAFIGSPAMNIYQGEVEADGGHLTVRLGDHRIVVPPSQEEARPGLAGYQGREVAVGIRPEHLAVGHELPDNPSVIPAEIDLLESLGAEVIVHLRIKANHIRPEGAVAEGEDQTLPLVIGAGASDKNAPGVARVDPRVQLKVGETVTLVPDTDHLQFFDLETGAAITS